MTANFSDLVSFVKAFISAPACSEINISLICQTVYTVRPFAENHWLRGGLQALPQGKLAGDLEAGKSDIGEVDTRSRSRSDQG
jgi:hypothetical protein